MSQVELSPPAIGTVDARAIVERARSTSRARPARITVVLLVLLFAAVCASVGIGDFAIPVADIVPALVGLGDADSVFVAQELRLPRVTTGLLVGFGFGLSGAIFQAIARNTLASPDIIGINYGATAGAVFVITMVGATYTAVAAAAFGGALVMAIAIYVLAYKGGVSGYRFVLVGIGLGATAVAFTSYLLTKSNIYAAASATVWLTGSLNASTWSNALVTGLAMAALTPPGLLLASRLRALQLDDDTAMAIGVGVERTRLTLLLVGVGLAGVGTAAAGPLAFVAFLAAPIARGLTHTPLTLVPAGLVGALLVVVGDLGGRTVFGAAEIPAGIVTGVLGAPYLLWLVARANRIGRGG